MKILFLTALSVAFLFSSSLVYAHSGGTNSCGGHNDRKRGGYHVHNYAKHCACYPNADECRPTKERKDVKTKKTK